MANWYSFVGRIIVERRSDDTEILEREILTTWPTLDSDCEDDLEYSIFDEQDVPSELGVYVILYAGQVMFRVDCDGEVDISEIDAKVTFIHQMINKEVIQYFDAHQYDSSDYHEEVTGGFL
jgi:hypothetical protein